eukprot:TRINITY_DN10370_c0_g1_i1.p1 TRINITY_DN10370_c0_g1~~TRINITY_DN10370_c0_g1_i1.p1  ORF type:complete len:333 (+),score=87.50 TRINITY_DN10370_c0_g1_i1:85-1083(+)
MSSPDQSSLQEVQVKSEAAHSHEQPVPVADIVYDFFVGAATYFKHRLQYAVKEKKISQQDFHHDQEIADCIKILDRLNIQSKNLSHQLNGWVQKEKDFNLGETRNVARFEKLAKRFEPMQFEELMLVFSEGLSTRAEANTEYVETFNEEFVRPVDTFYKSNIQQTKQKKKECNLASIIRENNEKAYKQKAESSDQNTPEFDQIARKREQAENNYGLISEELLMLVNSLEFKNRLELPTQILATLDARENYFKTCVENIANLKKRIAPLVEDLQASDFKPQYRPPQEQGQRKEEEESDEEISSDDEEDDDDDEEVHRGIAAPLAPPPSPARQQ